MPETHHDVELGDIIFTDNAITKKKQYGLMTHHIVEALKFGKDVLPLLEGTRQRSYIYQQYKQIGVIFVTNDQHGRELGAIKIISCWSKDFA